MKKVFLGLIVLALLLSPAVVKAEDGTSSSKPSWERLQERREQKKENRQANLEDVKQKVCDARVESIAKRSTKLSERASKMLENFARKADKVKDFYTTKLVPNGVTVSNYDELVAAVDAKKALVETAVSNANNKASEITCDDLGTAKTKIKEFRTAMQDVIKALNAYKTSIKNLLVAVRTAAGKANPSPSASPTP